MVPCNALAICIFLDLSLLHSGIDLESLCSVGKVAIQNQ